MELNEEELKKVLAGANPDVVDDKVIENESLYRQEQIEKLKQQKADLEKIREVDDLDKKSIKM